MNILAINASHRGDKGATALLIERIGQGAHEAGAAFEILTLARLKINRCLACDTCQTAGGRFPQCVYCDRDDAGRIFDAIRVCDLVIYAAPVYMFTLSALLKLLLERTYSTMNRSDLLLSESGLIHHHIETELSAKPFVALACCANFEAETFANVRHYFRVYSRFTGAPQLGLLLAQDHPYQSRAAAVLAAYMSRWAVIWRVTAAFRLRPSAALTRRSSPFPIFAQLKRFAPIKRIVIRESRRFYSGEPEAPGWVWP